MKYVKLGNSDLNVSKVCLGCMGFGDQNQGMHSWTLSYEKSKEIIQFALQQGINFFDTAMGYQGGTSEIYLGKAIKTLAKREEVIIATKFTPRSQEEIKQGIDGVEHVKRCLNASLERLQMDYVDLYIYHFWDENTPIEEIMQGLHELIQEGKVRYIGISNCYAYQLVQCNEIAKAHGWEPFISVQNHYNLIFREEEREMARYCKEANIAMTPYSPLASGRLAKQPTEVTKRLVEDQFAKGKYEATEIQDQKIIDRVMALANQKGVSMSEISLAWLMSKVASPIVGATKMTHIASAIKATQLELSEEEKNYLEELYEPHRIVGVMAQQH